MLSLSGYTREELSVGLYQGGAQKQEDELLRGWDCRVCVRGFQPLSLSLSFYAVLRALMWRLLVSLALSSAKGPEVETASISVYEQC